ncbi:hypothetical protein B0H19DRAFT_1085338 [Mycena capillaripes]|nr:hypothetical protein B0H19DRAFT_1085338 [Mycena capillaripes]
MVATCTAPGIRGLCPHGAARAHRACIQRPPFSDRRVTAEPNQRSELFLPHHAAVYTRGSSTRYNSLNNPVNQSSNCPTRQFHSNAKRTESQPTMKNMEPGQGLVAPQGTSRIPLGMPQILQPAHDLDDFCDGMLCERDAGAPMEACPVEGRVYTECQMQVIQRELGYNKKGRNCCQSPHQLRPADSNGDKDEKFIVASDPEAACDEEAEDEGEEADARMSA